MSFNISIKEYFKHYYKTIFLSFLFSSLFAHGFAMSNFTGANDTMGVISGFAGPGASFGRWFLDILTPICKFLFGNIYALPWFTLFLGFFLVSCASFLVLYLFQIQSHITVALITSLMIVFPAVTSIALFPFAFHFDMLSLFLAVCATTFCFICPPPKAFLYSIPFLVLSLGTYQAYLPFACALMVLFWIKKLADGNSYRDLIPSIFVCGITFFCGLILYLILTKFFCFIWHYELASYRNIHDINTPLSIKNILYSVIYSYGTLFFMLFKKMYCISTVPLLRIMIGAYYMLSFFVVIALYKKLKKRKADTIMLSVLLFIFPLASNLIYFMMHGNRLTVYTAMCYGIVAIFLFLPIFLEKDLLSPFKKQISYFIISSLIILWSWTSNVAYTANRHVIEQNMAVWNRIITEAEALEGYTPEMPVYIIGDHPQFTSVMDNYDSFRLLTHLEYVGDWALPNFLKNQMGWDKTFISSMPSLSPENLPVYPTKGSISIIDGVIVMRFE